jgi:outer membrane receptor protein involved in Fe transport
MSLCIIFSFISVGVYSQADSLRLERMTREEILQLSQDELLEMSMENLVFLAQKLGISIDELLNMKTSVASKTTLTPRETPGIVSFITEEEIRYSGARDLIDVLRLVPGFDFGYDVSGVIGAGLRGNWVHEGKILMLIDGQSMNELNYYNIAYGNHFPVDQIKRIEIIRGPGSAIYGGIAELGVINIITKSGKDTEGIEVAGTYGQMQKSMGRANLNMNSGLTLNKWDISAKGFIGKANRSDQIFQEYIDMPENTIDLSEGGSEIKTSQLNLGATNEKLSFRLIYDDYKSYYNYYDFDSLVNYAALNEFRSILGEVKYDLQVTDKLRLIPKINYKYKPLHGFSIA